MVANTLSGTQMNSLPDYSIRYSKRAKYIRLSICPQKGLEVILPHHTSADCIPELIKKKKNWINKHLKSQQKPVSAPCLPHRIYLQASDQTIRVAYQPDEHDKLYYQKKQSQFILQGNTGNRSLVQLALVALLKAEAFNILSKRIAQLAQRYHYQYRQIKIRAQKTRWGSCSNQGNINLNYKLIFLPAELCDYVLLHELCHTKHLNHSIQFWQQLEKTCPGCRTLDKQMKQANQYIPQWLDYPFKEQR